MRTRLLSVCLLTLAFCRVSQAEDSEQTPNTPDEPFAAAFSLQRAMSFLDTASVNWQNQRKCMTCHTNYYYLLTVGDYDPKRPALGEVRKFAESLVQERWESKGPRWDAEVVMTAVTLAANDAANGDRLHPLTRKALDRMWTLQKEDGSWDWLKCGWPPMESDDAYGVSIALIGVGLAPEEYASTPAAQAGLEKIRRYLSQNPAPTLHHRAMLLWAAQYIDGILTPKDRDAILAELMALQQRDGGWGLATLGKWKRADNKEQDTQVSDGYGTGFVLTMARLSGVPASDPRIRRGIEWLKTNQRASGRWFTRSLNKDNHHFITHAGTAFAVLALQSYADARTAAGE